MPAWAAALLAAFSLLVAAWDARARRVPNRLAAAALLCGLVAGAAAGGPAGLGRAALGAATGLGLTLPLWLLGWCGAGDCKAAAALCAFLGPGPGAEAALGGLALAGAWSAALLARRGRLARTLALAAGSLAAGSLPRFRARENSESWRGEATVPVALFLALAVALRGLSAALGICPAWLR
jgi:prepilin peptidase CpaA